MDTTGTGTPPPPNPNHLASASPSKPMLAFHFLRALSRIHRATPVPGRTRTICRAAYSSMVRATSPRRAWSRALLRQAGARRSRASSRPAVLLRRRVVAGAAPPPAARSSTTARETSAAARSSTTAGETSAAAAAAVTRAPPRQAGEPPRADTLRRLVPGGAGMEYCSLLEETADYVRCLRAQVQLMQGLVDLFSCQ